MSVVLLKQSHQTVARLDAKISQFREDAQNLFVQTIVALQVGDVAEDGQTVIVAVGLEMDKWERMTELERFGVLGPQTERLETQRLELDAVGLGGVRPRTDQVRQEEFAYLLASQIVQIDVQYLEATELVQFLQTGALRTLVEPFESQAFQLIGLDETIADWHRDVRKQNAGLLLVHRVQKIVRSIQAEPIAFRLPLKGKLINFRDVASCDSQRRLHEGACLMMRDNYIAASI